MSEIDLKNAIQKIVIEKMSLSQYCVQYDCTKSTLRRVLEKNNIFYDDSEKCWNYRKLQEDNFVNTDIEVNNNIVENFPQTNSADNSTIPNPCLIAYENIEKRLEKLEKLQSEVNNLRNTEEEQYNKLLSQFNKEKDKGNSVFSVRLPTIIQKELREHCEKLEISVAEGVWVAFSLFLKKNK